jgi:hypothetical protein
MVDLPINWDEISYEQYKELVEIKNLDLPYTQLYIEILALLWDISPDDDIFDMDIDEFIQYTKQVEWILRDPVITKPHLKWNEFTLKNLNKLSLGEFIDIENKLNDIDNNLDWVASVVYKKTKTDEWGNTINEPYTYEINHRIELFNTAPLTLLLSIKDEYLKWRENFMLNYEELFNPGEPLDKDEQPDEELMGVDIKMSKINNKKEQIMIKWSWENLLWNISGEDILKIKDIFNLNVIFVFNMLAMKKSLS